MRKLIGIFICGFLVGSCLALVKAATTSDSDTWTNVKNVLVQGGWTAPSTDPPPVTNTKPTDIVGVNWTVMAPFSKPNTTSSPQNLYITPAQTDPTYASYLYMKDNGVAFLTFAGGVHSPNSSFPRTELREMKDTNWNEAKWSNKTGTHTLEGTYSITSNLVKRNQVVFAQAHDSSDDIFECAMDGNKLVAFYNDKDNVISLEPNYIQGTKFSIKLVGQSSHFDVYYNGILKGTVPKSTSSGYWKTGSYPQTSPAKYGEDPSATDEVIIYSLKVTQL